MGFAKGKPKAHKAQTTPEFFTICPKHSLPLAECYLRKNVSVKVRLDFMAVPCVVCICGIYDGIFCLNVWRK